MRISILSALLAAAVSGTAAKATTVLDPANDFIASYGGIHHADLDVTSFTVVYDPVAQRFDYSATLAGAINTAFLGRYVIGVQTGSVTPVSPFAGIGAGNVVFNQAFSVFKDGHVTLTGQTPSNATISGNSFSGSILLSQLPSTGFAPLQYGWNLWPRDDVSAGTAAISDFAPNNALIQASPVPEPATWALMIGGFGLVGGTMRRRTAVRRQTAG